MKAWFCSCLLLCFVQSAFPCIWVLGTKYKGTENYVSGFTHEMVLFRAAMKEDLHSTGTSMEAELRGSTGLTNRNDYCVALMYLGRSQEAVPLLQQLEKDYPGNYSTAANLGTAYELSGNNQDALRWILEDIHRNPDAHMGTEWLHAKILEAKIAAEKDPDYFQKHTVLDLDPDSVTDEMNVAGRFRSSSDIENAIRYQLEERMELVKPKDMPVAALLHDYAAISAVLNSVQLAKKILRLSVEYGYTEERIQPLDIKFDRQIVEFDRRVYRSKVKRYIFFSVIGIAGMGLLWSLYKSGIFVISSRDLKRGR
jgi:tetratricopeptide (TPR) repeat protein